MKTTIITKSGHKAKDQNCFNEYIKERNKEYKGYEYFISDHIIYIYEDKEPVKSAEIRTPKNTLENWAKYYIDELINLSKNNTIQ